MRSSPAVHNHVLALDIDGVIAFLERCLDRGVLLTPGSASGEAYANWVRVCFTSVPPDVLSLALDRLAPLFR